MTGAEVAVAVALPLAVVVALLAPQPTWARRWAAHCDATAASAAATLDEPS